MIPIHDGQGRLRGFGGRVLDDGTPKYLNSPETELFQKKSLLYAFHAARPQILQSRRAIIMEGYMDVILAHQQGVKEAVAALGTSFTDEHATQLRRNADHVVLVFDGDAAGLSAAERSLPILLAQGLQVSVVVIPGGQDPGDLFASGQTERFQELLASGARDAVDFLLDRALERHGQQGLAGRVQAGKQVIELLGTLRDPLQRELFVKRIAERLGVSESTVLKSVRAAAPAPRAGALRDPEPAAPVNRSPRERAERECLAALLQDHELRAAIVSDLRIEDFTATAHQRLLALLQAEPASPDSPGDLLDRLREDGELSGLVVELVESVAVVNGRAVVSELLSRTRRAEQWQELRGLKQQWQEHGGQGQGGGEDDLLRAYLERLKGLKSARGRSAEV
jgi:DNA primase